MEILNKVVQSEIVVQALGYGLAMGVAWLVVWLHGVIKAQLPAEMVDRMWDAYLVEAAEWVWHTTAQRVKSKLALSSSWRAEVVLEGLRQLEEKWSRHEDVPLSMKQLAAAQGELEDTIERAQEAQGVGDGKKE